MHRWPLLVSGQMVFTVDQFTIFETNTDIKEDINSEINALGYICLLDLSKKKIFVSYFILPSELHISNALGHVVQGRTL